MASDPELRKVQPQLAFRWPPDLACNRVRFRKGETIFSQGDAAEGVLYLLKGRVRLSVVSLQGREVTVALLAEGSFVGESIVANYYHRAETAIALADCELLECSKAAFKSELASNPEFAEFFLRYALSRAVEFEEDLLNQLLNNTEQRLARLLLALARYGGEDDEPREKTVAGVTHEVLAGTVGTTRSRVSFFMNKFRRLGYIDYGDALVIRRSLFRVLLKAGTAAEPVEHERPKLHRQP